MVDIEALIEAYAFNKSELDSYKKLCDKEGAEIKEYMKTNNLDSYNSDNYVARYTEKTSISTDELKLFQVIKNSGLPNLIRTKEYVDTEALESAIYRGDIPKEVLRQIAECQTTKHIPTLTVKVRKK